MPSKRRPERVEASLIRSFFDRATRRRAEGGRVVDLSIGQPHLPAPAALRAAACEGIEAGLNGYTPTTGIEPLREAVLEHARTCRGYSPEEAIVTAGTSGGLTLALLALAEPDDDVLLPDPYFVSYPQLVAIAGARPVYYDTYPDFRLRPETIAAAVTERTRVIVINSPANPTGAVHDEEALRGVAEVAQRHGVVIVADEIYDTLLFDTAHASIARFHENTVTVSGWGKSLSVTGWRVGYATGPAAILNDMAKLQQFTFVCVSEAVQRAVLASRDRWDRSDARDAYRANRDRLCEALAGSYNFVRPGGAFYLFPQAPWGDGSRFCEYAASAGLLAIPGGGFSRRNTHFRLSFAVEADVLEQGIELLLKLARRPAAGK